MVTTLLDSKEYTASDLAGLYLRRWNIELFFRDIKTTMGMDVLRCLTPKMVEIDLWMYVLAYNLVRAVMMEAALKSGVSYDRISFKGTLSTLRQWYWHRTRKGGWTFACKTRRARLRRAIQAVYSWCWSHRHEKVPEQHAALVRRIQGHMNYFGVSGNTRALTELAHHAQRAWFKWLCRRSNKTRLTWERFHSLLAAYPLPRPRVYVRIWGSFP